jgi:hypothetical protein
VRRERPAWRGGCAAWTLTLLVAILIVTGCAATASSPLGSPPTATAGALRLTTDHSAYALTSPIGVTVTNAGAGDLYAIDGRSACAVIQLQRYNASAREWISVVGCPQATSPRINRLAAGVSIPFSLAPTSSSDPNKWDRGLYRVAVAYSANPDATTDGQIALSAGFTIS